MTEWLNSYVPALGTKPIDLLDTPDGRDLVATHRSTGRGTACSADPGRIAWRLSTGLGERGPDWDECDLTGHGRRKP